MSIVDARILRGNGDAIRATKRTHTVALTCCAARDGKMMVEDAVRRVGVTVLVLVLVLSWSWGCVPGRSEEHVRHSWKHRDHTLDDFERNSETIALQLNNRDPEQVRDVEIR